MEEFDKMLMTYLNNNDALNITNLNIKCCKTPLIVDNFYYHVCSTCGTFLNYKMSSNITDHAYKKQLYVRKSYFREKFRLLMGAKINGGDIYISLINTLKNDPYITTIKNQIRSYNNDDICLFFIKHNIIYTLRQKLKELNLTKMYKYIYNIIYDLFNYKCFDIPVLYLDRMTNEWLNFEMCYKKVYQDKRNLIGYNVILRLFLKKYNLKYYKLIILPKNKNKVFKHISRLEYFKL